MYFVYILQSLKDLRTYTGYSDNVERRLKQHNSGQVLSTKNRIPFKIFLLKNLPPVVKLKKENYIGKVVQEEEN
jgi:putative endonuclease